ncbi:MAG: DUF3800 domain-containing protein [Desulfobacterales bacterium]
MEDHYYSIIAGLSRPGLNVVFCDESETSGSPGKGLAPDLKILCGLAMRSAKYAEAKAKLESELNRINNGVARFHATEMVNPGSNSDWKNITYEKRVAAFQFLSDLVIELSQKLFYCFISKEQYDEIREKAPQKINMKRDAALNLYFKTSLIRRSVQTENNVAIVMDRDRCVGESLRIESGVETKDFYEGGIISAPSHLIPGLQLADHAAYTITRYRLKKEDLATGGGNSFDKIVVQTLAQMSNRVECLL